MGDSSPETQKHKLDQPDQPDDLKERLEEYVKKKRAAKSDSVAENSEKFSSSRKTSPPREFVRTLHTRFRTCDLQRQPLLLVLLVLSLPCVQLLMSPYNLKDATEDDTMSVLGSLGVLRI